MFSDENSSYSFVQYYSTKKVIWVYVLCKVLVSRTSVFFFLIVFCYCHMCYYSMSSVVNAGINMVRASEIVGEEKS